MVTSSGDPMFRPPMPDRLLVGGGGAGVLSGRFVCPWGGSGPALFASFMVGLRGWQSFVGLCNQSLASCVQCVNVAR
jgi:hypothetical protein